MTQGPGTLVCPKGHISSEPDYCSECGARMPGVPGGAAPSSAARRSPSAATAVPICPDCGTPREQTGIAFCEVCGFNFNTGAHGELVPSAPEGTSSSLPSADAQTLDISAAEDPALSGADPSAANPSRWAILVSIDRSLGRPESPEPPLDFVPFTVELNRPLSLIGRANEARAIFPEVALSFDEAVSRRHALLQKGENGALTLRDIGSANGTRLNGRNVVAMTDTPLSPGDEITLGHWSRLTVQETA